MKKFIASILCFLLVIICVFTLIGCTLNPNTKIENYNVEGELKVGIISDSQLPPKKGAKEDDGVYKQHLINALSGLRAQNVNMILFAGDIGNEASNYAYDTYYECYRAVYGQDFALAGNSATIYSKDRPLVQTIMGNHDYWGANDGMLTKSSYRKRFEKKLGHSPYTHYVVNGYHFIGASPEQGSPMYDQYKTMAKWLDNQISKAVEDDPNKPVFVMTHNSPKDTVYGSEDWGDIKLYDVFAKYQQVVNISGHLHYSIIDERSMWQGEFTAFSTQSVSYTELEEGKVNGTIPPTAAITPMGEIMEFQSDKLVIKRMNFGRVDSLTGAYGVEEKTNMRWELSLPLKKETFAYTNAIKFANNQAPTMISAVGSFEHKDNKTYLKFNAGSDDDFVHTYKLLWTIGNRTIETLYFTDFINGLSSMKSAIELPVYGISTDTYDNVKIYAVDSYGLVSSNFVTINNVVVQGDTEYKKPV